MAISIAFSGRYRCDRKSGISLYEAYLKSPKRTASTATMIPAHEGMNATNATAEYRKKVLARFQALGDAKAESAITATSNTQQVIWNGKMIGQNMD